MIAKKLNIGDTIGLISPASPENIDVIENGIKFLKNKGFNVKKGENIYKTYGYLAGSDKERSEDLINMFTDKSIKMILCVRGGYGCMRTLPYINFNIIKDNPKIFVGFSDITTYLNVFYEKCSLITFHGPMLNSTLDEITFKSLFNTAMNPITNYTISNPSGINAKCNFSKSVEGILVGGNLSLICSTLGTDYEINTRAKILFIEEVGEDPYSIDRMLTQLILSNKLDQCTGIVLGQFTDCTLPHYERSLTLNQVIDDRILALNKPTISNFMSGHDYPKLTLPIGARVRLNAPIGSIEVLEPVIY
ncbi:S66 peptidase family protein [Clostridium akagii]|uniref:S66 peptidase family protein n=1 Tax=Clostridium akagii TaxID=91623 RepID=UPI00047E8867|nr:LD-carboxypeptidase [Clostridium akagii]